MYIEPKISKNKAMLIQLDWWKPYIDKLYAQRLLILCDDNWIYYSFNFLSLISIMIRLNKKEDHAGFFFNIDVFGLNFIFNIYDCRHWDYEKNKWKDYENENTNQS